MRKFKSLLHWMQDGGKRSLEMQITFVWKCICIVYILKVYLHFSDLYFCLELSPLYFNTIVCAVFGFENRSQVLLVFMNNNKILLFISQHRRRLLFCNPNQIYTTLWYECHPHPQWATENWILNWTARKNISHYLNKYKYIFFQMWRQQIQFTSFSNLKSMKAMDCHFIITFNLYKIWIV